MAKGAQLVAGSLRDFSGGPNLRDIGPELADNECADAWNITFDERGNASSRLGHAKQNSTLLGAARITNQYWSSRLGKRLTQSGTGLYLADDGVSRHTFTTTATCVFAETNAAVAVLHPVDGLFLSTDGITWTVAAAAPKGTCLATWQNKVFIGQPNGKLAWSAAGDPTTWGVNDFVEIWELDQAPLVALQVGSGQDILGRPGLLVFKQDSFYRVNDSATGAYTTVDGSVGAAGPLAVVGVGARVCFIGKHGVFWWREDQAQAVNASDRLLPLWQPNQLNLGASARWCAGRSRNRALFSLTRAGASDNNLALELDPDLGWLAPRSDAMTCYATSSDTDETVFGGSPTANGQVYQLGTGGTDDGAPIAWRLQTRWLELNGGFRASLWQARLHGRGAGMLTVRADYQSSGGTQRPFNLVGDNPVYDTGLLYDTGVLYGTEGIQQTQAFYSLGVVRQISLLLEGSSTLTASGPQVFGQGIAPEIGYFSLASVEEFHVPLGLS